jgi:hypothetical protein
MEFNNYNYKERKSQNRKSKSKKDYLPAPPLPHNHMDEEMERVASQNSSPARSPNRRQ